MRFLIYLFQFPLSVVFAIWYCMVPYYLGQYGTIWWKWWELWSSECPMGAMWCPMAGVGAFEKQITIIGNLKHVGL